MAVLGVAMIVAVIGASALWATRIRRHTAGLAEAAMKARFFAPSAIDLALFSISQDPDWRTNHVHDTWTPETTIHDVNFTYKLVDENDGDLQNDSTQPVRLNAKATVGDAVRINSVLIEQSSQGLSCLEVSLQVGNDLVFDASVGSITANGDQIVSVNNTIQAIGDVTVYPAMEAVNGISPGLGPGSTTSPVPPREMPDEATVFDYYEDEANTTLIDSLDMPGDASIRRLEGVVLSPNSNPYGPTDPNGVYRIDCRGSQLYIGDCRIVGTLVLMNASSLIVISNAVNWEPAVPNYPALLMRGTMRMGQDAFPLDEVTLGVNFNPPGTPYQSSEDSLIDDQYPSVIKGLVYVSGDLSLLVDNSTIAINGVLIVANTLTVQPTSGGGITLDLTYDQRYYDNPPPGFRSGSEMLISPGTWRQEVIP